VKWSRETQWNLISECKRYRISKAETPAGTVYTLWKVGTVPHLHMGDLASCKAAAK
jgi:hypothetical protein